MAFCRRSGERKWEKTGRVRKKKNNGPREACGDREKQMEMEREREREGRLDI